MYDTRFNTIISFIFKSEGGYSNDKLDPGGPTNFGITQETYDNWNKAHNKPLLKVKGITKEEAKEIYYQYFWIKTGASKIKDMKMAYLVFDSSILCGPYYAKRFYEKSNGDIDKFLQYRKQFHKDNIKSGKSDPKWEEGWNNRIDEMKRNTKIVESKYKDELKKELKKYGLKYTPKMITEMDEKEFRAKEKEIEQNINEVNKNIKKEKAASHLSQLNGAPTDYAAAESDTKDKLANNSTPAHNPIYSYINNPKKSSELINFDGISHDGIPFKNWSEKNQRAFLEGVFGESLEEVDKKAREKRNSNNKKGNWTDMSWIFLAVQIFRSASTVLPFPLHKIFTLACLRSA